MSRLRREFEPYDDELIDDAPSVAPGKVTLTARLGATNRVAARGASPGKVALTSSHLIARSPLRSARRAPDAVPPPVLDALETESGAPLPGADRWSSATGGDVSGARVVTGDAAARASSAIDARAFTVGERMFFGEGEYQPDTDAGASLMRHELTHVAQQKDAAIPDYGSLAISTPHDSVEREARGAEHAAPVAPQPAGASISRAPRELESTPGGQRLGRELDKNVTNFAELRKLVADRNNLYLIDRKFDEENNTRFEYSDGFSKALQDPLYDVKTEIDSHLAYTDPARQQRAFRLFLNDLAVLVHERFKARKFGYSSFKSDVDKVAGTYKQLAELYKERRVLSVRIDDTKGGDPAANQKKEQEFERRANLFIDFAQGSDANLSRNQIDYLLEGVAGDIHALENAEGDAPVRGGQTLVNELLGEDLYDDGFTRVEALYRKVIDDVAPYGSRAGKNLLYALLHRHMDFIVEPAKKAAQKLRGTGDQTKLDNLRIKFAREVGSYLAKLNEKNAFQLTISHLVRHMYIVSPHGTGKNLPKEIEDLLNKGEQEPDPGTRRDPKQGGTDKPPKPKHACKNFGYDYKYVYDWLTSYWGDKAMFRVTRFDPKEVQCTHNPGIHEDDAAQVASNVADFRAMAGRALGFIDRSVRASRKRAAKIHALRLKLGMTSVMAAQPDYVDILRLAGTFHSILVEAAREDPLDPGREAEATALAAQQFMDEEVYQSALIAALELLGKAKTSGMDRYLQTNYRDTHYMDLVELHEVAAELPAWTGNATDLAKGDGLSTRVGQVKVLVETGAGDRKAERNQAIEDNIYRALPPIIEALRKGGAATDRLTVGMVWPILQYKLYTLETREDQKLAKGYLETILDQVNRGHLDALAAKLGMDASRKDTLQADKTADRVAKLAEKLDVQKYTASVQAIREFVAGESQNLVGLFTLAESVLGSYPGDTIRQANLLRYIMEETGAATLSEAYAKTKGFASVLLEFKIKSSEKDRQRILKDSDKGIVDSLTFGKISWAFACLDRSMRKGALKYLTKAEKAGGGAKRAKVLVELAEKARDAGGTQGKAVAEFIYAYALDAAHLLDENMCKSEDKRDEAVAYFKGEKEIEGKKQPWHPVHQRPLTGEEKKWFAEWGEINGEGTSWYKPSEKTWAKIGEFAKTLLKMVAIGLIAGPAAAAIAGKGTLAALVIEAAIFTGATRLITDLETGVTPESHILEDLLLNLVMMKAARFSHKGFEGLLAAKGWNPNIVVKGAGAFAAEYLAVSGVSLTHLVLKKGSDLKASDVTGSLLHNFAFIAAMKGMFVLGGYATEKVIGSFSANAIPKSVKKQLRAQDDAIKAWADAAKNAKDSEGQIAALRSQGKAIERKAKILERAAMTKPFLSEMAASYRAAAKLYNGDAARAGTFVAIGAQPVPGSPNFSYARSGFAESALARHLAEGGMPYNARKGLRGTTFEVLTPGGKIRFQPRGAGIKGAGTAKGAFTAEGRLEETRLTDSNSVLKQVNLKEYRAIIHPTLRGRTKSNFSIRIEGVVIRVQIKVVDAIGIKTVHRSGPVAMELHPTGKGAIRAYIEVRRNTANDHLVRGLNHELAELALISRRVKQQAPNGRIRNYKPDQLAAVLKSEASTGMFKRGSGDATSHDVALVEETRTLLLLGEKILQLKDNPRATPKEQVLLNKRLELLRNDLRRMWSLLKLPKDKKGFQAKLEHLEKTANVKLSRGARDMLARMHMARAELKGWVKPSITEIELQIIFNELKQANPKEMAGTMLEDLLKYYREKISHKASTKINEHLAKHPNDPKGALAAGMAVVKEMAGGTSISSWRGRAFEGLSIQEWNADPQRVAAVGFLYQIKLNNYPTHDAIAIKGAPGRVKPDIAGGVQVLKVGGKIIYKQGRGGKPDFVAPGVSIRLISMKAKKTAGMREMKKAIGTPDKPTGHGMLVTPAYKASLEKLIAGTRDRVDQLKTRVANGDNNAKARLAKQQKRLQMLEFFHQNIEVSKAWSNARIDAMLNAVKRVGIDWKDLKGELKQLAGVSD